MRYRCAIDLFLVERILRQTSLDVGVLFCNSARDTMTTAVSERGAGARWPGVRDLARRYGLSEKTIRRMMDRGELPPARRFGRLFRWDPAVIEAWEARE